MAQLVTRKARSSVLASAKLYQPARALREDEVLYWRGDLFWPPRGHCRLQKKLHHEDHETDKTRHARRTRKRRRTRRLERQGPLARRDACATRGRSRPSSKQEERRKRKP